MKNKVKWFTTKLFNKSETITRLPEKSNPPNPRILKIYTADRGARLSPCEEK